MKDAYALAELRVLVGYLGELAVWWESQFYGTTSGAFLAPIFGRSLLQAQYQGITAAAARVHDDHIGVGRSLHLFRMPELYEQAAAAVVADRDQADAMAAHLYSQEQALDRLATIAMEVDAVEGPVAIGEMKANFLRPIIASMAGHYLAAFQSSIKTFPYLREAE